MIIRKAVDGEDNTVPVCAENPTKIIPASCAGGPTHKKALLPGSLGRR